MTNTVGEMTLGAFIKESENYTYSKEYFELLKECYETELLNMYIESAEFVADNYAVLLESDQVDNFLVDVLDFTESAGMTEEDFAGPKLKTPSKTSQKMKDVGAKVSGGTKGILDKIKAILSKINQAIKTLWARIVKFFKVTYVEGISKHEEFFKDALKNFDVYKEGLTKTSQNHRVGTALSNAAKVISEVESKSNITVGKVRHAGTNAYKFLNKLSTLDIGGHIDVNDIKRCALLLLSASESKFYYSAPEINSPAFTEETMRSMVDAIETITRSRGSDSVSADELASMSERLDNLTNKLNSGRIKSTGMVIDVTTIADVQAKLQSRSEEIMNGIDAIKKAAESGNEVSPKVITKLSKLSASWKEVSAASIKGLADVNRLCTTAVGMIDAIVAAMKSVKE